MLQFSNTKKQHMKTTLLAITTLLGLTAQAQITLTNANFAQPGDTIFYGVDTTTKTNSNLATSSGANKVWDFSGIGRQSVSESVFISPANSPVPAPANITHVLVEDQSLEDIIFMNVTNNGVQTILPNPVPFGNGDAFLSLNSISFPLSYQTRTKDTVESSFVLPASLLQVPLFDSVRITLIIKLDVLCDGWGTLKTPTGEYNSLRLKQSSVTDFKFEGGTFLFGRMNWVSIPVGDLPFEFPSNQLDVSYIWLSENSKYFLAEATMLTDTPNTQVAFRYQVPRPTSTGIYNHTAKSIQINAFPNPANDVLNIEAGLLANQTYSIVITDITGKTINSFKIEGNNQTKFTLPTDNLNSGLYFLNIFGSEGQATVKFNVNR